MLAFKILIPDSTNKYWVGWADQETLTMLGSTYWLHVGADGVILNEPSTGTWGVQKDYINNALSAAGWRTYDTAVNEARYSKGERIPNFNFYTLI